MQKEQERQQFKMMKQNIKQFEREMKRMTQYVTSMEKRLKRQNIGLPQELQNALTEIPGLTAQLKAAEDFEQFEEAMSKMQDVMMVIQDWSGRLHELEQLGQMLKDVQRQVNDMYRSFKQLQARLKRRPELQEELKSLEAMVGVMSRRVTDAKALAKTDSEEALNKVREVFDNTEEFWSEYQFLQMVSDLLQGKITPNPNQIFERSKQSATELIEREGAGIFFLDFAVFELLF